MTGSITKKAVLTCHPETNSETVREIEASARWTHDNALIFTYALKADLTRLCIPPPRPRRRADRLWQHTCFEAFVSVRDNGGYCEFNFAPSGEWAVYSFQSYRDGTPLADSKFVPKITVRSIADQLDVDAIIRLEMPSNARLRLALCAVIEDQSGKLSYWALRHPAGKPDFHHPDCFALDLELVNPAAVNEPALEKR